MKLTVNQGILFQTHPITFHYHYLFFNRKAYTKHKVCYEPEALTNNAFLLNKTKGMYWDGCLHDQKFFIESSMLGFTKVTLHRELP
jgi:hypothetical protein